MASAVDIFKVKIDQLPEVLPAMLDAVDQGFGNPPFGATAPQPFLEALTRLGDMLENIASVQLPTAAPGASPVSSTTHLQRQVDSCGSSIAGFMRFAASSTIKFTPSYSLSTVETLATLPQVKTLGIVGCAFLRAYSGEGEGTHAMDLRALLQLSRVVIHLGVIVAGQPLLSKTSDAVQAHFGLTHPLHVRLRLATGIDAVDDCFVKAFFAAVTAAPPQISNKEKQKQQHQQQGDKKASSQSSQSPPSSINDAVRKWRVPGDSISLVAAAAASRFSPISKQVAFDSCNHAARLQRMLLQSCWPAALSNVLECVCSTPAQRSSVETKQLTSKVMFACAEAEWHCELFQAVLAREAAEESSKNSAQQDLTSTATTTTKKSAGQQQQQQPEGFEAALEHVQLKIGGPAKRLLRRACAFLRAMHVQQNASSSSPSSPLGNVILTRVCVAAFQSPRLVRLGLSDESETSATPSSDSFFDSSSFHCKYVCCGDYTYLPSAVAKSIVGSLVLCANGLQQCVSEYSAAKKQQQQQQQSSSKGGGKKGKGGNQQQQQQQQQQASSKVDADGNLATALRSWTLLATETTKLFDGLQHQRPDEEEQSFPQLIPLDVIVSLLSPAHRKNAVLQLFSIAKNLVQLLQEASPALRAVVLSSVQLLSSAASILGEAVSMSNTPPDEAEVNALRRIVVFVFVAVSCSSDSLETSLAEHVPQFSSAPSSVAAAAKTAPAPNHKNNNSGGGKKGSKSTGSAAAAAAAASSSPQHFCAIDGPTSTLLASSPKAALQLIPKWKVVLIRDFITRSIAHLSVPPEFFFAGGITFLAHCSAVIRGAGSRAEVSESSVDPASTSSLRVSMLLAALLRFPDRGFLIATLSALKASSTPLSQLWLGLFRDSSTNALLPRGGNLARRHCIFIASLATFCIECVSVAAWPLPLSLLAVCRGAACKVLATLVTNDSLSATAVISLLLSTATRDRVRIQQQASNSSKKKQGGGKSTTATYNPDSEIWPTLFIPDDDDNNQDSSCSNNSSPLLAASVQDMRSDDDTIRDAMRQSVLLHIQESEARAQAHQQRQIEEAQAQMQKDEASRKHLDEMKRSMVSREKRAQERTARIREAAAEMERARRQLVEDEHRAIAQRAEAARMKAKKAEEVAVEERKKKREQRVARMREVEAAVVAMREELEEIGSGDNNSSNFEIISAAQKSLALLRVRNDPSLRLNDVLEMIVAGVEPPRVPFDVIERRQTELQIRKFGYDPKKTTIKDEFADDNKTAAAAAAAASKPKMLWEEFLEEDELEHPQQQGGAGGAVFEATAEDDENAPIGVSVSTHMRLAELLDLFAPHDSFDAWKNSSWRTLYHSKGLKRKQLDWNAVRDVFTATDPNLWTRLSEKVLLECVERKLVEKHPSSSTVRLTALGCAYHAPFFDPHSAFADKLIEYNRDRVKALLVRAADAEARAMFSDTFDEQEFENGPSDVSNNNNNNNNADDDDDDTWAPAGGDNKSNSALFGDDFFF